MLSQFADNLQLVVKLILASIAHWTKFSCLLFESSCGLYCYYGQYDAVSKLIRSMKSLMRDWALVDILILIWNTVKVPLKRMNLLPALWSWSWTQQMPPPVSKSYLGE
jgi:hypothetical protein